MTSIPCRTAIYGGSFNPIHQGHINLAKWLCDKGFVDELWFLVSPLNPLKEDQQHTMMPDELRLRLVQLAVKGLPNLKASDFEMSLPRPSYMVNTLRALREAYPEREFILIIGADNWHCFALWRNYEEILRKHQIIIYPRPGYPIDVSSLPDGVRLADAPLYDISSTNIRKAIVEGKYNGDWLNPEVWEEMRKFTFQ